MLTRRMLEVAVFVVALALLSLSQVLSNGTCSFAANSGSVHITSPTPANVCYAQGENIPASADYSINWSITGITPEDQHTCNASYNWGGELSIAATPTNTCKYNGTFTNSVVNAANLSNGTWGNTITGDDKECIGIGNWVQVAKTINRDGSVLSSQSVPFKIKATCP